MPDWRPLAGPLAAWRKGTGPRLVFVHGFTQTSRSWRHIADHFNARGHETVIVDLPGHGESAAVRADLRRAETRLARVAAPRDGCAEALGAQRYADLHVELARAREPRARPDASLSVERTITATSSASVERADGETAARSTSANQLLDIRSLLRAAESFTADHALPELIERLLRLVIENVGAERGLLLLADGDDLRVELEQSLRRGERSIHHGTPLREGELVAAGLVLLTTRGEDPIAIDDAREDPRVASDPYVQRERPRALLCAPLRLRGRLLGALYLENNLAPGVFTERRQAALRLLGLQAAIAIAHVQVYARLERARAAAEAASAAKSRFLANMSHDKHKRETA